MYDNFDIDFKTNLQTVDQSGSTLTHLTSGTLIFLEHGVTPQSLRCSAELWQKSPLNPLITAPDPPHTIFDFVSLYPDPANDLSMTRTDRFNSWMFYRDLCSHGPDYFSQFQDTVGLPEFIKKILVVKMRHAPARAMDINQSTASGNIQAISNLMEQGGVGVVGDVSAGELDFEMDNVDVSEHVILINGDLATGEHVYGILERR